MDLECTSGDTGGAHEGGGRPHLGRAPCLVDSPEAHRRTSSSYIYPYTLKTSENRIDREFRRRKPLYPPKTNRDPVPAPCRRGEPSTVVIFIIPTLSMTRRE